MGACAFEDPPLFWEEVVNWCTIMLKGKSLKACLGKLSFGAVIYHLWRCRNDLQHGIHLSLRRARRLLWP
jgi:hypothetical protein